jgi:hypothetical protein
VYLRNAFGSEVDCNLRFARAVGCMHWPCWDMIIKADINEKHAVWRCETVSGHPPIKRVQGENGEYLPCKMPCMPAGSSVPATSTFDSLPSRPVKIRADYARTTSIDMSPQRRLVTSTTEVNPGITTSPYCRTYHPCIATRKSHGLSGPGWIPASRLDS